MRVSRDQLPLAVSADGYVRLTRESLRQLSLVHILSGLDVDDSEPCRAVGACVTTVIGFTEWAVLTEPALSMGWYWRLDVDRRAYERIDFPYSNLMFVDSHRRDFGHDTTAILLAGEIDALPWQPVVERCIGERYSYEAC